MNGSDDVQESAYLQELKRQFALLEQEKNGLGGSYQLQISQEEGFLINLEAQEHPPQRQAEHARRVKEKQLVIQQLRDSEAARLERQSTITADLESALAKIRDYEQHLLDNENSEQQAKRDHEREMKIIDHEIARENRLAAEAAAKVAATAQEQASQSMDSLLKGLQGDDKT